jgi:hypothetical protein
MCGRRGRPGEASAAEPPSARDTPCARGATAGDGGSGQGWRHRLDDGRRATASHLPRVLASVDAFDSDPVTSLARSLDVVTVAVGKTLEISLDTALTSVALAADT